MKRLSRNDVVLVTCFLAVFGMVGMSYAAVPLYYAFCRTTGYGGTPRRAEAAPSAVSDRSVTVSFDTNVDPALPWRFVPEQHAVRVKIGEDRLVYFRAINASDKPILGHAAFNISPGDVARYFNKIQCFCFTEQRLEAGESVEMPVTFFVSPDLLQDREYRDTHEITLSYTFYRAVDQRAGAPAVAKGTGG
jgi:cytochrome c oxidase assembly protein subunit 11